jgi:hypothetical protein
LDLEVDFVPAVVDGRLDLQITRLEILNLSRLASALIAPVARTMLEQQLDQLSQMQHGLGELGDVWITDVQLSPGEMRIEGLSR